MLWLEQQGPNPDLEAGRAVFLGFRGRPDRRLLDLARRAGVSAASLVIADALRFGPCAAILTAVSSPEQVADIARGMALDDALARAVEGIFGEPEH